jgi:MFS family permease
MKRPCGLAVAVALAGLSSSVNQALAAEAPGLPGVAMSFWWAVPFAGLLLSIATGPLLYPHLWERHYGKIAAGWAAIIIVPISIEFVATSLQAPASVDDDVCRHTRRNLGGRCLHGRKYLCR